MDESWRRFVDILPGPTVVLNSDQGAVHFNPAFEAVFGWKMDELPCLPFLSIVDDNEEAVCRELDQLSKDGVARDIQTRWSTKAGRKLSVVLNAALLPAGMVITLQNLSADQDMDRSRQTLLRLSKALHRFRKLDRLLRYITRLIQVMMQVGGASVIFLDSDKKEFYFHIASLEDTEAGRKLATVRFPADKGVAGEIYRTGKPLIVDNYANSRYAFKQIDEQAQYETRNMLDVPLHIKHRMIGVLCAVNKRDGAFNKEDVELLSAIADVVALPIENARVNEALQNAYERVKAFNQAKERVIVHLSHELKTPLAVLSASLQLLEKQFKSAPDQSWRVAYERAQRNLQRLLEMEYAVEDLLRQKDPATFDMITQLPRSPEKAPETDDGERFFQQVNIEFMIHELKDPLSVIETNAQLLDKLHPRGGTQNQRRKRLVDRILRGAQKVRALLEELLEVGRAEAVCFNCRPFAPLHVIQQVLIEVVESHAPELYDGLRSINHMADRLAFLAAGGLRLEAQSAVKTIQMVQDETKFRQIAANLLKNALTYRRRLLLIHLSCHRDTLTLSIRDDGPGVADEHKDKIFERYTQVSPFPGVARSGHGLGLAVSRILARSMDGDLFLESQLGQGAVFRLTLPLEFDTRT